VRFGEGHVRVESGHMEEREDLDSPS
jgi:hypothetical protein